jgi:flagellar protein FliO/FliZ
MINKTMYVVLNAFNDLKTTPAPTEAAGAVEGASNNVSTMDSFLQLVGLVVLLVVILFAAYYTSKFVGGIKLGQMKNSNFQVIDAYRISPNKVIQIVKIANKYIVIAIGKDTVNYITELDEAEVYIRETHTGEKQSFKQTLEKLRNYNK